MIAVKVIVCGAPVRDIDAGGGVRKECGGGRAKFARAPAR
jgi:hypothetical protein